MIPPAPANLPGPSGHDDDGDGDHCHGGDKDDGSAASAHFPQSQFSPKFKKLTDSWPKCLEFLSYKKS